MAYGSRTHSLGGFGDQAAAMEGAARTDPVRRRRGGAQGVGAAPAVAHHAGLGLAVDHALVGVRLRRLVHQPVPGPHLADSAGHGRGRQRHQRQPAAAVTRGRAQG